MYDILLHYRIYSDILYLAPQLTKQVFQPIKMALKTQTFQRTKQPLFLTAGIPPRLLLSSNQRSICQALVSYRLTANSIEKRIDKFNTQNKLENKVIYKKDIPSSFLVHNYIMPPSKNPNCICDSQKKSRPCSFCSFEKTYQKIITQARISISGWEAFQTALEIRVEGGFLTQKQSRLLRHLLEHFVIRYPQAKDETVTPGDVSEWFNSKLPETLKNYLPRIANPAIEEAKKKSPKKKKKSAKKTVSLIEKGSHLTNKRKAVSNTTFEEVVKWQGLHCYWCGIKVTREAAIPVKNRLRRNNWKISYKCKDQIQEDAIATIDHLQRVADNGTNHPSNLVISCYPCNLEREKETRSFRSVAKKYKKYCQKCGTKFIHLDQNNCTVCGVGIIINSEIATFSFFNIFISIHRLSKPHNSLIKSIKEFISLVKNWLKLFSNYQNKQKIQTKKPI